MSAVKEFVGRWHIKGFRSEYLWRTPSFLETLSNLFEYDSSIPNVSSYFTKVSRNGCAAINPYYTHGNMIELPLTLPMDNAQKLMNISLNDFWEGQVQKAKAIIERGGLVVLSLHPQPYQSANNEALKAYELALK